MLTAARSIDEHVADFGLGADDYFSKPFEFPELFARIRALARRNVEAKPPVLEFAGLRMDTFRKVQRDGVPVHLARKEFAILE